MAEDSFGTAHVWGVAGSVSSATVIAFNVDSERVNTGTVEDEDGNQIERRYDDTHDRGTITLRYQSGYSIPSAGDTITYDSSTYEITNVGQAQVNRGMREITLSILKSEFISYS